jgi:hypothetical protein
MGSRHANGADGARVAFGALPIKSVEPADIEAPKDALLIERVVTARRRASPSCGKTAADLQALARPGVLQVKSSSPIRHAAIISAVLTA